MALDTYSGLQDSIASWLARVADTQITGNAADFITLAEAHLNRNLRVRQMETVQTFTTSSGVASLSDDYLGWKRLTYMATPRNAIAYRHPNDFEAMHPEVVEGVPVSFTIEGGAIKIRPYDDDTEFEFLYYDKIEALSDDNTSNWLLTEHPDLYLAASLAEANAFLLNPEHATLWAQKRDTILGQIELLSIQTGAPSAMHPSGYTV
jgi:hypothetical protein